MTDDIEKFVEICRRLGGEAKKFRVLTGTLAVCELANPVKVSIDSEATGLFIEIDNKKLELPPAFRKIAAKIGSSEVVALLPMPMLLKNVEVKRIEMFIDDNGIASYAFS